MKQPIRTTSTSLPKRSLGLLVACLLTLGASSSAFAAETQITEGFDVGTTLPTDWSAYYRTGVAPDPNYAIGIVGVIGDKRMLRLQRPSGQGINNNLTYFYTGSEGHISNGVLGNFTGSLTVRTNQIETQSSSVQGVVVGVQSATYDNLTGFYVAYDLNGLYLYQNPTTHAVNGTLRASDTFSDAIIAGTDYDLRIAVNGATLTASIWSMDGLTQIGGLSYTAGADITGLFGLRTSFGNSDIAAYFGDVNLTAYSQVPEPATTALALAGLIATIAVVRRRRRS